MKKIEAQRLLTTMFLDLQLKTKKIRNGVDNTSDVAENIKRCESKGGAIVEGDDDPVVFMHEGRGRRDVFLRWHGKL